MVKVFFLLVVFKHVNRDWVCLKGGSSMKGSAMVILGLTDVKYGSWTRHTKAPKSITIQHIEFKSFQLYTNTHTYIYIYLYIWHYQFNSCTRIGRPVSSVQKWAGLDGLKHLLKRNNIRKLDTCQKKMANGI